MKICRRHAHTRQRSEFRQPDVRTPHFLRAAHKSQRPMAKFQKDDSAWPLFVWTLAIWNFDICTQRVYSLPPSPPTTCRRLVLPGACRRWGFVMRYRSATVAGFHGLLCFVELIKKNSRDAPTKTPPPSRKQDKSLCTSCGYASVFQNFLHNSNAGLHFNIQGCF